MEDANDANKVQIGMPPVGSIEKTKTSMPSVITEPQVKEDDTPTDQTNPHIPIPGRSVSEDPNRTLTRIPRVSDVKPSNEVIPAPVQPQSTLSPSDTQPKISLLSKLRHIIGR